MMKTNLKPQLSPFASQTTTEYKFKAHMGKGGSVQTMPVNDKQLHEIKRAEDKEYKKGVADSPEDEAIHAHVVFPLTSRLLFPVLTASRAGSNITGDIIAWAVRKYRKLRRHLRRATQRIACPVIIL
jgi:hypothetical protein